MSRLVLVAVICATAAVGGCGGTGAPQSQPPTDAEFMADVKQLIETYQQGKKKAPAKIADLEPLEPGNPSGFFKLNRGDVVYAWGVPIAPGGTRVLAHKKDAATAGGTVLREDGTVKEMQRCEAINQQSRA